MKVQVKSIRESHWGMYDDSNCYDAYDILMNYDAVDFCDMCNSSEGSAIADQLCDILTGEEELKDQNPNALEYIKQFCERKGEMELADAIAKYLEDEGQDGTLDKFMESKKNNNKSVKKESSADSDPVYEELYNKYVPGVGKADTVLGEVLRACSQVIYRWYNDGDQFNEDYGVQTAGSSAMYLMYHQPVQSIAKIVKSEGDTTFNYGPFIEHLEKALIDLCHNESEVEKYAAQSNGIDSRSDFIRDAEKEFPEDEWE